MKKKLTYVIIIILLAIGVVSFKILASKKVVGKAALINIQTPEVKTIEETVSATGMLKPVHVRQVYVSTDLTVDKVNVAQGDLVHPGEVLMTFDDSNRQTLLNDLETQKITLKAQLLSVKIAEFNYQEAKKTRSLDEEAYKLGGISNESLQKSRQAEQQGEVSWLQAKNSILSTQAAIIKDENALKKTVTQITSQVNGVIEKLTAEPNYTINLQDNKALASIADLTTLKITADISQFNIAKITVGQDVKIISEAYPGQIFMGKVNRVSGMANDASSGDFQNTTVPVEITLNNNNNILRPNYNVSMEIITSKATSASTIPSLAIKNSASGSYVLALNNNNTVYKHPVNVGIVSKYDTSLINIDPTLKIITTVSNTIVPGMKLSKDSYKFVSYAGESTSTPVKVNRLNQN